HPGDAEISHAQVARQKAHQANAAEQMLGTLPEAGEEFDRQQIEEAFDEAAHAILGATVAAGPMLNGELADAEAAGRGQHRNETVQLTIEANFTQHFGAVALHAAI